jgi:membrane-bound ClpP family serine protease
VNIEDLESHYDVGDTYWFAPKLFGWGATPVTWQGWALIIGFVALLLLDLRLIESVAAKIVIAAALTAGLAVLSCRKTDGGCHWHWGLGK